MARQLFTVGYEGVRIDTFIANLLSHGVTCVLDVRALPLSRKPGFSKNRLAQRLEESKIDYVHLGDLGTPKAIRDDLKSTKDYFTFFAKVEKYLSHKKETLELAYKYVTHGTCCLMCFERLAAECHRKIVARDIKARDRNGLKVVHI
jgi:uncharacterized protein (DUF488 family)